jgi:hypothetical protein
MLKVTEKLVQQHIRDKILRFNPLHENQSAYQALKSTETALHRVVKHTEKSAEHSEIALGAFLDIEGAYDSTSFEVIIKAAEENGIGYTIWPWVSSMLGSRNITPTAA